MNARTESEEAPKPGAGRRSSATRLWAGTVFLGTACVIGLAIYLQPAPEGHGTHRQLGLGECGMLVVTGLPCPSCGMTTAFAHTVRGQWLRAFWVQPAGFLLALGCIATCLGAVRTVIIGRMPRFNIMFLTPYRLFLGLLVLLLGGWGFKMVVTLQNAPQSGT